jgi:putative ABC transport system permease protein
MLRNFFFVFLRSLTRQLSYSLINIVGLAIGIACSLVIFLFVYGEWSYDRGFANSERIYKVGISFFNIGNFGNGPERLLTVLPEQYEGVEAATRIRKERGIPMEVEGKSFREDFIYYTDSSFFKVFQHQFVYGDPGNVLKRPNEIVLTEASALKYFGTTDAIGKRMSVGNDKTEFVVAGIVKENEFNATVKSGFMLSNHALLKNEPVWSSASFFNFILIRENQGQADLQAALDRVWEKNVFPETGKMMGFTNIDEYRNNANSVKFHLHALRDVYLKSNLSYELIAGGSETNIYIFSAISVFILVLAGVNFINLTTARASRRAKEVGIRKTMGTSRGKLIFQFLSESVMISTLAMLLSLVLAELFLIAFTYVTGTPLLETIWNNTSTVLLFVAFSILVGVCSGLYPAFYLTSFNPVKVLKGNVSAGGGLTFRNVLVVFQFGVSMILIVCAIVVQQQLHFVQTKDLGFDQNNIITIDQGYMLDKSKAEAFTSELASHSGVTMSSFHMGEPGSRRFMSFYTYQTAEMPASMSINTYLGDASYLDLMGMKLIHGRGFNKDLQSDTASIILNESAVAALGLPENPIGTVINTTDKIIGVVSDFHWESLHNSIAPLAIRLTDGNREISFKMEASAISDFLALSERKWKELVPNEPFKYHFVDGNFEDLLKKDRVFGKAINFFTMLAIFISCLGLYGLSAFTAEQRTREIGIRKVLGATSGQIVMLLNRKFTILVSTAIVISIPFSVWLISMWLDGFAYKITPGIGVFLVSIVVALVTAWITVSFHSIRASWANPSESLKYE